MIEHPLSELSLPAIVLQKRTLKKANRTYYAVCFKSKVEQDGQIRTVTSRPLGEVENDQQIGRIVFNDEALQQYPQLKEVTVYRKGHNDYVFVKHNEDAELTIKPDQDITKLPPSTLLKCGHYPEGDASDLLNQLAQSIGLEQIVVSAVDQKLGSVKRHKCAHQLIQLASICLQCALEEHPNDGEAQLRARLAAAQLDDKTIEDLLYQFYVDGNYPISRNISKLLLKERTDRGAPPFNVNCMALSDQAARSWQEPWFKLGSELSSYNVVKRSDGLYSRISMMDPDELLNMAQEDGCMRQESPSKKMRPMELPTILYLALERESGLPCFFTSFNYDYHPAWPVGMNMELMTETPATVRSNYLQMVGTTVDYSYFTLDNKLLTSEQLSSQQNIRIMDWDCLGLDEDDAQRQLTEIILQNAHGGNDNMLTCICHLAPELKMAQAACFHSQNESTPAPKPLASNPLVLHNALPLDFCQKLTNTYAGSDDLAPDSNCKRIPPLRLHLFVDRARQSKLQARLTELMPDLLAAYESDQRDSLPPQLQELAESYQLITKVEPQSAASAPQATPATKATKATKGKNKSKAQSKLQPQTQPSAASEQAPAAEQAEHSGPTYQINWENISLCAYEQARFVLATTHSQLSPEQIWAYFQEHVELKQLFNDMIGCGLYRISRVLCMGGQHYCPEVKLIVATLAITLYQLLKKRTQKALQGGYGIKPNVAQQHYLKDVRLLLNFLNGRMSSDTLRVAIYHPRIYYSYVRQLSYDLFQTMGLTPTPELR